MTSIEIERRADRLHSEAIVIDAHSDILMPVADGKMQLSDRVEVPDPATWEPPPGLFPGSLADYNFPPHVIQFGPMGQYDVPRWREGGVTVEVCTVYLEDDHLDRALHRTLQMIWHLRHAAETVEGFDLVTTVDDIHRIKRDGGCGAALSFEGCEPLGTEVRFLDLFHALGLRMASLTHCRRNLYADGPQGPATTTGGLTDRGRAAIRRMNELGIVVDLVHINPTGYFEILELTTAPVVLSHASHTNFPSDDPARIGPLGVPRPELVLPRDREMLEALAANGGVLGVIWLCQEDVDAVVRDIETAIEAMGPDHVGLGSDMYGLELAPVGLEDMSKTPAVTRALVRRGHDDDTILKILGGNFLRVFEQVWGSPSGGG